MNRLIAAAAAMLLLVTGQAAATMLTADDPAWKLESKGDGITLYRCAVKGSGALSGGPRKDNLTQGTWYFTVVAYTSAGLDSAASSMTSKTIQ